MQELPDGLPPTFTTRTAREIGIHTRDLYRWRDQGVVLELSRGVFRRGDAPAATYPDALAVSLRAPQGIVCCVSAAAMHDLTDEIPATVQFAVPTRSHVPVIDYPPVTVFRFTYGTFELGLSGMAAAPDELFRVYDSPRTVVDLFRFRKRLGEPVAHTALNRFLAQKDARPSQLLTYANALGIFGPVRAALDIAGARWAEPRVTPRADVPTWTFRTARAVRSEAPKSC